jgi:hypothetical protein
LQTRSQRQGPKLIGQHAEAQGWKERGAKDGTAVILTVRRRSPKAEGTVTVDVRGQVLANRQYRSADNRPLMAPNGPQRMASDGFDSAWSSFYESERGFVRLATRVLDGGFSNGKFDNRMLLADLLQWKPRVEYVLKHHPGPFATALSQDFEEVRRVLMGTKYTLGERELEYRQLGEKRAAQIAEVAKRARDAFLAAHSSETIAPFPAVDPIRGDRTQVAGKIVSLPPIQNRDWVMEAGHCYLASGDSSNGFYFADCELPSMKRMFAATYRYQKLVSPRLDETWTLIGTILPDPKMLVVRGRAAPGLRIDPIGAMAGDKMFVDLTVVQDGTSPFAGEEGLTRLGEAALPDHAPVRRVMEAWVEALKRGEEKVWRSFYAPWRADRWWDGSVNYSPFEERRSLESEWVRARRLILGKVFHAQVVYVGDVRRIMTGREFAGAPVIDEVQVELEHVGQFEGEYRAFTSVAVNRPWTLQRRGNGPWRIASGNGL